jgi:digeranylgeranylglycerophospholipid reductase
MEDVVISGAGPAGLVAAKTLAEHGISPLVLEEHKEYGKKPCGGLVVETFLKHSIFDFTDSRDFVEGTFDRIIINLSGKDITFFPKDAYMVINRKRFERSLSRESKKLGASIRLGERVSSLSRSEGSILINGDIKTKILIGADGFYSVTRRFVGEKIRRTWYALQGWAKKDFEYPHFFFDPDLIRPGYAWCFPGKTSSNVGIGGSDKLNTGWKKLKVMLNIETKPNGFPVPVSLPCRTFFDNILLAGDAASQVDPLTGGGINIAIIAGRLAGETAGEGIEKNRFDSGFLKGYEKEWKKILYRNLMISLIKQKMFNGFLINHKRLAMPLIKGYLKSRGIEHLS